MYQDLAAINHETTLSDSCCCCFIVVQRSPPETEMALQSKEYAEKEIASHIVDRFVWKKMMKGKAGIRWDKVVENVWKEIGGNKKEKIY